MPGQIRLFDNDDETQTGKQGKGQASLVGCRVLPAIRLCWNLLAWKTEGIGRASSLPHLSSSRQPPTSCRAGDGHSELGEARPQLILSADSQGLWKRSFLVQWGQRSGVYSSGFQSLSQWELWTSTLGWDVRVCSCAHVCPCMPARGDEDSGFNCVVPGAHYRGA